MPADLIGFDLVQARKKLEALGQMSGSEALKGVASLFKRVKNITKDVPPGGTSVSGVTLEFLKEPAELALLRTLQETSPIINEATSKGDYLRAFQTIAALRGAVAQFFDDVLVMTDDRDVRLARLTLVAALRDLIVYIADISEMAPET
jgi:glycyl-tRNA synthetase beta chain